MKEAGSYDDIIHMKRPVSRNHRPMARLARAAQFSPFAAFTELEGTMAETARLTEPRRAADESRLAALNEKTGILAAHAAERRNHRFPLPPAAKKISRPDVHGGRGHL